MQKHQRALTIGALILMRLWLRLFSRF